MVATRLFWKPSKTFLHVELSDKERDHLLTSHSHLAIPSRAEDNHPFLAAATKWFTAQAPKWLIELLFRFRSGSLAAGIVVIDNFGVDPQLPPTPTNGRRSTDSVTSYSEAVTAACGSFLGDVFGFEDERDGDLLQSLTAVKGKENALTNEGAGELGWHNEHAVTGLLKHEHFQVIDFLGLMGLRGDHDGISKTVVSDVRDALEQLSVEDISLLRSPLFTMRPPILVRSRLPDAKRQISGIPVIFGTDRNPRVRVALYGDMTSGETPEATSALMNLRRAFDATQRGVATLPGRLTLLNNRVAVHGRSHFKPRFDGKDRWLLRILVSNSLGEMVDWTTSNSRVISFLS